MTTSKLHNKCEDSYHFLINYASRVIFRSNPVHFQLSKCDGKKDEKTRQKRANTLRRLADLLAKVFYIPTMIIIILKKMSIDQINPAPFFRMAFHHIVNCGVLKRCWIKENLFLVIGGIFFFIFIFFLAVFFIFPFVFLQIFFNLIKRYFCFSYR